MQSSELYFFSGFMVLVILILLFDLGIFSKKDHVIGYREAAIWTGVWVLLALGAYVFFTVAGEKLHKVNSFEVLQKVVAKNGHDVIIDLNDWEKSIASYRKAISIEYLTGYLVEYSLSVDNIFVIILIFSAFGVEKRYYHRVLVYGIIGAVFARFIFIFAGGLLISKYAWVLYLFAVFLLYAGVKMFLARNKKDEIDPQHHPVVRFASRFFRVHQKFEGNHFFVHKNGKNYITPLFLVLLVIEFSDIIFAVDSIPAIFAITKDTYIVFFSNIFAILGLRSMFFLLINIVDKLRYFKHGLSLVLVFIGLKMLIHEQLKNSGFTSVHALVVILSIVGISVLLSFLFPAPAFEEDNQ